MGKGEVGGGGRGVIIVSIYSTWYLKFLVNNHPTPEPED